MKQSETTNHRFTKLETSQPEFDDILMIVYPNERIMFENKAAKPQANIVVIRNRQKSKNAESDFSG